MNTSYQEFLQESMLEFVKKILLRICTDNSEINQVLYISYKTNHPLVQLSDRVKELYPQEITIVIQYQFENLMVDEKGFSVVLSFDGIKETIYVPFDALTNFTDTSNGYSLKFKPKKYTSKIVGQEVSYGKKPEKHKLPRNSKNKTDALDNIIVLDKFRKPTKLT